VLGPSCPERNLALSLVIARAAKPAQARHHAVVGRYDLGADLVPGALYRRGVRGHDWLLARQGTIEASLAAGTLARIDGAL